MKKRDVLNLIRYHVERNDTAFREEAYAIAKDFDHGGDGELAAYIMALLSDANAFVPQSESGAFHSDFLTRQTVTRAPLRLPAPIADDIQGVFNAIGRNLGTRRFLFHGPAGTGKTESVRQISAALGRDLYVVDFSTVVDSRLGQTAKNISRLFTEINGFTRPEDAVVLFDEIDALALDRVDSHDVREMGRATSALLRQLDGLSERIILFATTNLFDRFDRAFVRRFDATVDFGRYTRQDLIDVAANIMTDLAGRSPFVSRDMRLFRKIVSLPQRLPYPGELRNVIRSSIAFSRPGEEYDYLARLYTTIVPDGPRTIRDLATLHRQGFTMREIEKLTGVSRSTVARELRKDDGERRS